MTEEQYPIDPVRNAIDYLHEQVQESRHKSRREGLRDWWRDFLLVNGTEDENGSYFWGFPDPLQDVNGKFYSGLQAQRRVSEILLPDKAIDLIRSRGLESRCLTKVITYEVDWDELYALNQEGILSDDDIDSLFDTSVTYAVTKVAL